jgi:hypothetical protein
MLTADISNDPRNPDLVSALTLDQPGLTLINLSTVTRESRRSFPNWEKNPNGQIESKFGGFELEALESL